MLLCVNKADGKILWQGESRFDEIELTAQEKAQFEVERRQAEELNKQLSALNKESSALRKLLKDGKAPKEETEKKLKDLRAQSDTIKAKNAS